MIIPCKTHSPLFQI